jgi:UDP:flavonoid glycosyltransferase YjiC (YdhE family)
MQRRLRVLCSSTGGAGHVGALAPTAQALHGCGHDVQWAVAPDGGDAVGAMGFEWSPAGLTTAGRRELAGGALGEIMELPMAERRGPLFTTLFVRAAARMRLDLAPIIERFRPDVIVRETGELAAAPMAAARSIPLVTVAFSGVLPDGARAQVLDGLRSLWRDEGLDAPSWADVYGQLYLHPFPASFGQRPDSAVVRPLRSRTLAPSATAPTWVAELGVDRPLVYVTAGTERPAVTFPWRETFTALADLPVDVLATIGPHVEPERLGDVPGNIRVERFVPQADVLGRATVVVSHGGAGTVLGAAAQGRPQLVVPLFADQWENGLAVTNAGCGVVLGPAERSVEDFGRALSDLLDGLSYRTAAALVATEIAAMPGADELVPEIEALVGD